MAADAAEEMGLPLPQFPEETRARLRTVLPAFATPSNPLDVTGALLTVKALHELQRTGGKYALVTMCIGGGQGIAAIFERM